MNNFKEAIQAAWEKFTKRLAKIQGQILDIRQSASEKQNQEQLKKIRDKMSGL